MNDNNFNSNKETGCDCHFHARKIYKLFLVVLLGLCIIGGNAIFGWYVAQGLYKIKIDDRYVSVKGMAEKKVRADLAIWNISFKEAGNDLRQVSDKINSDRSTIAEFLVQNKIDPKTIEIGQTTVVDRNANEYGSDNNKNQDRYIITSSLAVKSNDIDLVKQVSSLSDQLVARGVVFLKDERFGSANPSYLFTKLDSIRPGMLETATQSARLVAEQFAKNSGSKLGKIKRANQGVFQIQSADTSPSINPTDQSSEAGSIDKQVRVITSIDYFLVE